jgi:hypothetical protein
VFILVEAHTLGQLLLELQALVLLLLLHQDMSLEIRLLVRAAEDLLIPII